MDKLTDTALIQKAIAAAKENGLDARFLPLRTKSKARDARGYLQLGKGAKYQVEVKRGLRPANLGATIHQLKSTEQPALLVADYVSPPMAQTLKENDVGFLDAVGNAYINEPPVLIWVKGEKPSDSSVGNQTTGGAFRPSGLKVVFAFLCDLELVGQPYRDIADRADVSRGTVGEVMADLAEQNFVGKIDGNRTLVQAERLLRQFADAYARRLRPKLRMGRYTTEAQKWWEDINRVDRGFVLGGEVAAAHLTKYLRPGHITLYAPKIDARFILEKKLRADPDGDVEILRRFWPSDVGEVHIAPLPLVYADLLISGDARCIEAADQIYQQIVNGFI